MQLDFKCPRCEQTGRVTDGLNEDLLACPTCEFKRSIPASTWDDGRLAECLACGERDLWRQKDFPQAVGIGLVVLGGVLSTIAWAQYQPEWAIGILMLGRRRVESKRHVAGEVRSIVQDRHPQV